MRPVVNLKTEEGVRTFEAIASDVADLVLEFGGALSGEHGDGLVRSPFMQKMFGPVLYEAFREIKRTFDPDGIFNPGKIVDAPPLTSNLRYGAGYRTPQPVTFFDYSEYGGMGGAVEMCSGLGACRKTLDGTMCPSYMATREEADSTRGRANVLRLAMAGRLGEAGLGDEGVTRGAGSVPRVPRLQGRVPGRRGRRALQERVPRRLLAAARHAAPRARARPRPRAVALGQPARARCRTALAQSAPARWLNERVLGLDRRRMPPAWASRRSRGVSRRQFRRERDMAPRSPAVLLFNDTFTNYYNPGIGMAGAEVLDSVGLRRRAGAERVLRPAADLAGSAR